MNFLEVDDVVRLHARRAPYADLVDPGKLDSALHRPRQMEAYQADATIHDMAAVLAEGICQAHAFSDGNKRAALQAVVAFYAINSHNFDAPDNELLYLMVDLTTHWRDAAKAAELFAFWATPFDDDEVEWIDDPVDDE